MVLSPLFSKRPLISEPYQSFTNVFMSNKISGEFVVGI